MAACRQAAGPVSASRLNHTARNYLLIAQSAPPMAGVRAIARAAGIVFLNLVYALRVPNVPTFAALHAVVSGTVDHLRGRFGKRPSS
jgi:hypothetical protein